MRRDALVMKLVYGAMLLSLLLGSTIVALPAWSFQSEAPVSTPPLSPVAIPFPQSEKLIFEVKISKFPIYATLGHVTFEYLGVADRAEIEDSSLQYQKGVSEALLAFRAEAISKGFLVNLIGLDVKDRFEALVSRRDFSARLSFKEEIEGKKHLRRTALFDQTRRAVIYQTVDVNKPENPPTSKELYRHDGMQSLLSAFYYLRLQELKDGQTICFPVSEDEENHQFEIVVGNRETLELGQPKIKLTAIKVEPKLFGPGRYFSRPGEMAMWLTDDERRVPLKLVAKTSAGTLTATLTNYDQQPPLPPQQSPETREPEKKDRPPDNNRGDRDDRP